MPKAGCGVSNRIACSVRGCGNTSRQRDKCRSFFHTFPVKDKELCAEWVRRCRNLTIGNMHNARVCSDHFTPEDYLRDLKHELLNLPLRKKLKPDAVPSIFFNFDEGNKLYIKIV